MNFKKYFFNCLILKVICENISFENLEIFSISKAIRDVAEEFYVKNQIQFDFVAVSDDSRKFNQLTNLLLVQNEIKSSHRLNSFSKNLSFVFVTENSAIILSVSCSDFRFINSNFIFVNLFTKSFKFLIYIDDCGLDFMENDIEHLVVDQKLTFHRGSFEQYEFLLINEGDFLYLATIEWFKRVACNQPQLKVLNSFSKTTQKWSKKLENYEKFQNFYGCKLKMWIPSDIRLSNFGENDMNKDNQEKSKNGLIPQTFIDISKKYNFHPKFQRFNVENESRAEVCFNIFRMTSVMDMMMHFTVSFLEIRDVILATPEDLYTPYEKLWLPFDVFTWKLLFFVFLLTFAVILVINQLPKAVQEIVYGENVHKPALNVMSAFFGIAQYKVPKKYFPRCLLIIFVYFCLIFRTCYQSRFFVFMTSEPRRPPPKSIEDLRDRNYTLYTNLETDFVDKMIAEDRFKWYVF